ncbi:MAG: RNA polymerase sigma factor [Lachnospiraceae bacterium]|nr:RNA polymerase sigma factor [Lachnospiraceae bacterium]
MREPVEDLIRQHQKHLFAAAFSICQNTSDADDVVQDTFLKYHISKKEFSSPEHIKAWLLRVAINKAKDLNRRLWKWNSVSIEDLEESLAATQNEDTWLLTEVMKLPPKYRIVLHLFYYEEYSVSEIAQILRISEGSVKTRLSRGRNMLKDSLEEDLVYD